LQYQPRGQENSDYWVINVACPKFHDFVANNRDNRDESYAGQYAYPQGGLTKQGEDKDSYD
jgi:hypothetical protein